ncbi:hypothetical protein PoB_003185000 [Plakobranchus ocellatus]|uniref:Uncharacterized protein n=1 Tax=Plakobranchus ocellatus TaxID=259542 RepID=A0AAV4ADD3_9GAST|nr:hypothetical protein PoB_003185000 [Plakobranchus ocellatus]
MADANDLSLGKSRSQVLVPSSRGVRSVRKPDRSISSALGGEMSSDTCPRVGGNYPPFVFAASIWHRAGNEISSSPDDSTRDRLCARVADSQK